MLFCLASIFILTFVEPSTQHDPFPTNSDQHPPGKPAAALCFRCRRQHPNLGAFHVYTSLPHPVHTHLTTYRLTLAICNSPSIPLSIRLRYHQSPVILCRPFATQQPCRISSPASYIRPSRTLRPPRYASQPRDFKRRECFLPSRNPEPDPREPDAEAKDKRTWYAISQPLH